MDTNQKEIQKQAAFAAASAAMQFLQNCISLNIVIINPIIDFISTDNEPRNKIPHFLRSGSLPSKEDYFWSKVARDGDELES
jgi:hypothetical protein